VFSFLVPCDDPPVPRERSDTNLLLPWRGYCPGLEWGLVPSLVSVSRFNVMSPSRFCAPPRRYSLFFMYRFLTIYPPNPFSSYTLFFKLIVNPLLYPDSSAFVVKLSLVRGLWTP